MISSLEDLKKLAQKKSCSDGACKEEFVLVVAV